MHTIHVTVSEVTGRRSSENHYHRGSPMGESRVSLSSDEC